MQTRHPNDNQADIQADTQRKHKQAANKHTYKTYTRRQQHTHECIQEAINHANKTHNDKQAANKHTYNTDTRRQQHTHEDIQAYIKNANTTPK